MTSKGWSVLALGTGSWLLGRLLGIAEVMQVALSVFLISLGALAWVQLSRSRLKYEVTFEPARAHRGDSIAVAIKLTNHDRVPTSQVEVILEGGSTLDQLSEHVPSIRPGKHVSVRTEATASRRGLMKSGDLHLRFTDPFGLAGKRRSERTPATLLVLPRVSDLSSAQSATSHIQGSRLRRIPSPQGEDFMGVRSYQIGDDPRKVHWPASARSGSLMVREEEETGADEVTIFVDNRPSSYPHEDMFEWSVDAAASIAALYTRSNKGIRLEFSDGRRVAFGRGGAHYQRVLDELAICKLNDRRAEGLIPLTRGHSQGILVVAGGRLSPVEIRLLSRTIWRFPEAVVIVPPLSLEAGIRDQARIAFSSTGVRFVAPEASETLAQAWTRARMEA